MSDPPTRGTGPDARLLPGAALSPADARLVSKLEALRPLLMRTASAMLRRSDDADDAVQEALLRLVRNADRYDPEKGTLEGLARTTVRRVALDMLARLRPEPAGDAAQEAPAPAVRPPLEAEEVRTRLRAAVDRLGDPQRTAFLLVHQEGLTHEEAARDLRISQETLRARLYRARIELRALLKEFAP
ncbi:MAG: sigma-70 family RNA polymerase sigma factor [Planctomycetota bacterium]|nr:sigma-70 family RNA polymerase sigma factor [Planctomycetota bacterium]